MEGSDRSLVSGRVTSLLRFMCVCLCVCVCVCLCVYVCMCVYVYMYVCMYVCMYVSMYVCVYVCVYVLFLHHSPLQIVILHAWKEAIGETKT